MLGSQENKQDPYHMQLRLQELFEEAANPPSCVVGTPIPPKSCPNPRATLKSQPHSPQLMPWTWTSRKIRTCSGALARYENGNGPA